MSALDAAPAPGPLAPATIELAYLGLEVEDREAFARYLDDVVGLMRGAPTDAGHDTWRNDASAQRIIVSEGPANDAVFVGFAVADQSLLDAAVERLRSAGYHVEPGDDATVADRRVQALWHTMAPWGVRVELVHGLEVAADPFASPLVASGFSTDGLGFGHVVFGSVDFEASRRFATEGLGLRQTDWLEMELAPGFELEVRFFHGNPRHHTLAVARLPFEPPTKLHHVMVEANSAEDVGLAFDRAWDAQLPIANGLGMHDNDGMFSFYVVTPAGFQLEFGTGGRVVTEPWTDERRYDRISRWGHQPLTRD